MDWFLKKTDWYLFSAVALLSVLSLALLYSLSVNNPNGLSWFYRQLVWTIIGLVSFFVFSLVDFRVFNSRAMLTFLYAGGILLLLAVLILAPLFLAIAPGFFFGDLLFSQWKSRN